MEEINKFKIFYENMVKIQERLKSKMKIKKAKLKVVSDYWTKILKEIQ